MRSLLVNRVLSVAVLTVVCSACAEKKEEVKPNVVPEKTTYLVPDKTLIPDCRPKATWSTGGVWADVATLAATYKSELEQCDKLLEPVRQWIDKHSADE